MNDCGAFGEACCAEYKRECKWREGECVSRSYEEKSAWSGREHCGSIASEDSCIDTWTSTHLCKWNDGECVAHCADIASEDACALFRECEWSDVECVFKTEKKKKNAKKKKKKQRKAKKKKAVKKKSKKNKANKKNAKKKAAKKAAKGGV